MNRKLIFIFWWCICLFFSVQVKAQEPVNAVTALSAYLNNEDNSYQWVVKDSLLNEKESIYRLIVTSQTWRDIVWKHEVMVIVPHLLKFKDALLFISGGKVVDGNPSLHDWNDQSVEFMKNIAVRNNAVTAVIWQVPSQPLYNGLIEDELISYTLHNFLKTKDYSWPLLFPMVKSAVRAMDAVQNFVTERHLGDVNEFVLTGLSKRGWTTWLTAANDRRVKAIAPMVIDVLNMPENIRYQIDSWGEYSIQIKDYVDLGLTETMTNPGGKELVDMIDPYSYRKSLRIPKLISMGTNDEYWTVDAIKYYIDNIPGENTIHYIPNVGHSLGDKKEVFNSINAFFYHVLNAKPFPQLCNLDLKLKNNQVKVEIPVSVGKLKKIYLWNATSDDTRFQKQLFTSEVVSFSPGKRISLQIDLPRKGYKAFYVACHYEIGCGEIYIVTSRMYLVDNHMIL